MTSYDYDECMAENGIHDSGAPNDLDQDFQAMGFELVLAAGLQMR